MPPRRQTRQDMAHCHTYLPVAALDELDALTARGGFRSRSACLTAVIHALTTGRLPDWCRDPREGVDTLRTALASHQQLMARLEARMAVLHHELRRARHHVQCLKADTDREA